MVEDEEEKVRICLLYTSGGTGGLQYKFSYEKDGAWVRIQDYSKSSSATWRPPEPVSYTHPDDLSWIPLDHLKIYIWKAGSHEHQI